MKKLYKQKVHMHLIQVYQTLVHLYQVHVYHAARCKIDAFYQSVRGHFIIL